MKIKTRLKSIFFQEYIVKERSACSRNVISKIHTEEVIKLAYLRKTFHR